MYVVTVEFLIHPEHTDSFKTLVLQQAENSLSKERDCHIFDVCQHHSETNRFYLYEIYSNEDAFQEHLKTDHFKNFDLACKDMLASKTVQVFNKISS